jgi:hypothetical protein
VVVNGGIANIQFAIAKPASVLLVVIGKDGARRRVPRHPLSLFGPKGVRLFDRVLVGMLIEAHGDLVIIVSVDKHLRSKDGLLTLYKVTINLTLILWDKTRPKP